MPREAEDAALRRGVRRAADCGRRRDRRHVHDRAATAPQELRDRHLRAEVHALEVHPQHTVPRLLGHVPRVARLVLGDAGVVHQHVDATEALDRPFDHRARSLHGGDVGDDQLRVGPRFADERDGLVAADVVDVGEHEHGTFLREPHRGGAPEPRARAGDDGDLPVEPHRAPLSWADPTPTRYLECMSEVSASRVSRRATERLPSGSSAARRTRANGCGPGIPVRRERAIM